MNLDHVILRSKEANVFGFITQVNVWSLRVQCINSTTYMFYIAPTGTRPLDRTPLPNTY